MKMKINGQTLRDKLKFLQRKNGRLDLFDFLLKQRGPKTKQQISNEKLDILNDRYR